MLFPVNYSRKHMQRVKVLSLCFYFFREMVSFNLALQQFEIGYGYTSLSQNFAKKINQKQPLPKENTVIAVNRPLACVRLVHESKIFRSLLQPLFPKLTVLLKRIAVICIHFTRMLLSNCSPLSLFSDSCLLKIRVKTWIEESYFGELP